MKLSCRLVEVDAIEGDTTTLYSASCAWNITPATVTLPMFNVLKSDDGGKPALNSLRLIVNASHKQGSAINENWLTVQVYY